MEVIRWWDGFCEGAEEGGNLESPRGKRSEPTEERARQVIRTTAANFPKTQHRPWTTRKL